MMLNESNEEETVSDPFLQKLNDHILLGEQLVKGWSGGFLEVALRRANLVGLIHQVVLANCARQLRSLKSLLSVAEGGDSVAGSMLVRSMFETTINVGFVMKPVWNHQVRGKKEKLTQELRAQLYLLHTQLELSQRQTRAKDKANKKSQAKLVFDSDSIALLPTLEKEVGAKWLKVLSAEPHTVTGESLETIAGMISPDLSAWYAVMEGEYPACNHAVGLNEFLPVPEQVPEVLLLEMVCVQKVYHQIHLLVLPLLLQREARMILINR